MNYLIIVLGIFWSIYGLTEIESRQIRFRTRTDYDHPHRRPSLNPTKRYTMLRTGRVAQVIGYNHVGGSLLIILRGALEIIGINSMLFVWKPLSFAMIILAIFGTLDGLIIDHYERRKPSEFNDENIGNYPP